MASYPYANSFIIEGAGINDAPVYAYAATRFSSQPALNSSAPSGAADAGPVYTGTEYGSDGAFTIDLPDTQAYYVSVTYDSNTYWVGPVVGAVNEALDPTTTTSQSFAGPVYVDDFAAGSVSSSTDVVAEVVLVEGGPNPGPACLVGGNASGAPTGGDNFPGCFAVNKDGSIWVCTEAGTPGTWVEVGGSGGSTAGPPGDPTSLATPVNVTNASSATSGSFTPTANSLVVVQVLAWNGSSGATLSISDTLGGYSWTQVSDENATSQAGAALFYAFAPGSPTSGTVTVTDTSGSDQTSLLIEPFEILDSSGVGATLATNGETGSLSAAPAATSLVLSAISDAEGGTGEATYVQPSGYTMLVDNTDISINVGDAHAVQASAYQNESASQTVTWTRSAGTVNGPALVAIEILGTPASYALAGGAILGGSGVPDSGLGADGSYYFRSDGGSGTHIYFKSSGSWAGIV